MSLVKTAEGISEEYRHIGNVRVSDKQIKICYEQLKDCQNIICSREEPLTGEAERLLSKIKRLVEVSRFNESSDYSLELISALAGNDSNEASLIRNKYFPTPEYDQGRDA